MNPGDMVDNMKQEFMQKIQEQLNNEADLGVLHKELRRFKNLGMNMESMLECLEGLRKNQDEDVEDRILELMDYVVGFCNPPVAIFTPKPRINMPLYETEVEVLEHFLESVDIEEAVSESYLILYNFALDCQYAKTIQPQLLQYLTPFYLKCAKVAILERNRIAWTVFPEFNTAMFGNQVNFIRAVGAENYQDIMDYYIEMVLLGMLTGKDEILSWVSYFNTTVALAEENIERIFIHVLGGVIELKYAFFAYLSVLLFKEGDNLLATGKERDFWTNDMWNFEGGSHRIKFCFSEVAINFYEKQVTHKLLEKLFEEVKPLLWERLGKEITELFWQEMQHSFESGTFKQRKEEFLQKMSKGYEGYNCWDAAH